MPTLKPKLVYTASHTGKLYVRYDLSSCQLPCPERTGHYSQTASFLLSWHEIVLFFTK